MKGEQLLCVKGEDVFFLASVHSSESLEGNEAAHFDEDRRLCGDISNFSSGLIAKK